MGLTCPVLGGSSLSWSIVTLGIETGVSLISKAHFCKECFGVVLSDTMEMTDLERIRKCQDKAK